MNSEESVFSFDLNESLFFNKGQEVAEIRGISLDPNISIQSFNEYISIRGVIELHGEYERIVNQSDETSPSPSLFLENDQAQRYIEEVIDVDHVLSEFNHRFPVEISVPTYRVDAIDQITVQITSFDYELPDSKQLNLMSTIEIQGINHERDSLLDETDEPSYPEQSDEVEGVIEQTKDNQNESSPPRELEETFEFELKEEELEDAREPEPSAEVEHVQDTIEPLQQEDEPSSTQSEESDERWLWKKKQVQTLAEFFENDFSDDTNAEELVPEDTTSYEEQTISDDPLSSDRETEHPLADETDVTYLTDMFREDEENYTKMRLCIVQDKDTLETIAERYGTTSMHLAAQNNLTDDDVSQGQLLYIPFKKQS